MANLRHIQIRDTARTIQYLPRPKRSAPFALPLRERVAHAQKLRQDLQGVVAEAAALHPGQPAKSFSIEVEFRSDPAFQLMLDSLENRKAGIEVASVHKEDNVTVATVHVPPGKMSFFLDRIKKYETEDTLKAAKPKHANLVESIASIRLAEVRSSFWTDQQNLFPEENQAIWWEVWLRCPRGSEGDPILAAFRQDAPETMRLDRREVRFRERAVLLVWCTPRDWSAHPELMDHLAELRKSKEPPGPYVALAPRDQADFVRELRSRVTPPPSDAPAVCILDTGVAWEHPLLNAGINQASVLTVDPRWLTSDHDGHGTEVAGLGLYGPLADLLQGTGPVSLRHCLESVKILPPLSQGANDPRNYGAITQEAVARAEAAFPSRNRSVCMGVTADDRDQGFPTLWSAAVDQLCSGDLDDNRRRLVLISAGNVRDLSDPASGYRYPETNQKRGIEDPGQSWNAVTVGACTDLVHISELTLRGWNPIAPKGSLCPTSRTSMLWGPEWPIKPDLVMEGGNWATDGTGRIDAVDDLSLLTTAKPVAGRLLTTTRDTSAAVALAARMAAIIQSRYPAFWPETVRGLMIHSAEWTREMLSEFPDSQRKDRLRCYGWGVPQLDRAIWSAENAVTLIYEGQLQPFCKADGSVKTRDMHIHRLPWPTEVLQDCSAVTVRMRVTLSYFIEPSPGQRGWTRKYSYRSHGLRFDVKRPTESLQGFRNRLTREVQKEDEAGDEVPAAAADPPAESQPWALGQNLRSRGSIHSDSWEGSASQLAECGHIGVVPQATGWWRDRPHLERWDHPARYSLIVSLETRRMDIDLYTPIAIEVGITPEIET